MTLETRIYVAKAPTPLGGDLKVWAGTGAKTTIPPLILAAELYNTRKGERTLGTYIKMYFYSKFTINNVLLLLTVA